jgi:transposase-like protein
MRNINKSYTTEFKQEAVQLALNSPNVAEVARSLGIPEGTLHTWLHRAKQDGICADPSVNKPKTTKDLL